MIKGMKEISANIQAELKKIKGATDTGLLAAGNVIISQSKENTPVDTGTLQANQDAVLDGPGVVSLNVRSNYAIYVHENVGERLRGVPRTGGRAGNFWDGGGSKFLERAMDEKRKEALDKIKEFAEIKE